MLHNTNTHTHAQTESWCVYVCVRAETCPHQSLHVVHGPQVVPDDRGRHLASNILAEFVSNTDHVEVAVHACEGEHDQMQIHKCLQATETTTESNYSSVRSFHLKAAERS